MLKEKKWDTRQAENTTEDKINVLRTKIQKIVVRKNSCDFFHKLSRYLRLNGAWSKLDR